MPLYESVFIARQDISGAQVDALADGFAEVITNGGGQIAKREYWGLRNLAYRIKKNRKGHYVLLNLDAPADAVHEMERLMRLNDDVLRFLTLRVDELDAEPSTMMQGKSSERRERADRGDSRRDADGGEERGERATVAAATTNGEGDAKEKPDADNNTDEGDK